MSVLQALYPGDRVLELCLIVALGVMLLSTAAWVVARRLPKRPATRHLVLISALFGCLAMPFMAMAFNASGLTLISIPLLPAEPFETGLSIARAFADACVPVHPAFIRRPSDLDQRPEYPGQLRLRSDDRYTRK